MESSIASTGGQLRREDMQFQAMVPHLTFIESQSILSLKVLSQRERTIILSLLIL